jgi:hypothetical protein
MKEIINDLMLKHILFCLKIIEKTFVMKKNANRLKRNLLTMRYETNRPTINFYLNFIYKTYIYFTNNNIQFILALH